MGCDIHIYVERRAREGARWQMVRGLPCDDCDGTGLISHPDGKPEQCWWCNGRKTADRLFHHRSYTLFGVLAGVRHDDVPRIDDPRGVPDDISFELAVACSLDLPAAANEDEAIESSRLRLQSHDDDNGEWLGDHSFSWLTVEELLGFDWNQPIEGGESCSGWVKAEEFIRWRECGRPSSWCKSVGGGAVRHVEHDEMARLIGAGKANEHTYTFVKWGATLATHIGDWWLKKLELLRSLGDPRNVRVVFGFDS